MAISGKTTSSTTPICRMLRPVSASGAKILGVDFAPGADDGPFGGSRGAFHEWGVIAIRDQTPTPDQHVAAARRFGAINLNRFFTPVEGTALSA